MKAGVAFDVTGVLLKSKKAIPKAKEALMLLKERQIPFVVLTNAGGRTEAARAQHINEILGTDILSKENVIQSHTPMQLIYKQLEFDKKIDDNHFAVIGGSEQVNDIADNYGFRNYVTVQELCALQPQMVPLNYRSGYPISPEGLIDRVRGRFKINKAEDLLKRRISAMMMFSTPFMMEAHLQIVSDIIVSKGGLLGTQREKGSDQFTKLYYGSTNMVIPVDDEELPNLQKRYVLGAFKKSFEDIFNSQYGITDVQSEVVGKPSRHAFTYAKNLISSIANQKSIKYYMVGDSPKSDIKGGNDNGFDTYLVKTGNYKEGMDPCGAKHIVEDVHEAVIQIIRNHS